MRAAAIRGHRGCMAGGYCSRDATAHRLPLPRRRSGPAGRRARVRAPRRRAPSRPGRPGEHPGRLRPRRALGYRYLETDVHTHQRRRAAGLPRRGPRPGHRQLRAARGPGVRRPRRGPDRRAGARSRRWPTCSRTSRTPASTSTSSRPARSPRWPPASSAPAPTTGSASGRSPRRRLARVPPARSRPGRHVVRHRSGSPLPVRARGCSRSGAARPRRRVPGAAPAARRDLVTAGFVRPRPRRGPTVHVWTVDDPAEMHDCSTSGSTD